MSGCGGGSVECTRELSGRLVAGGQRAAQHNYIIIDGDDERGGEIKCSKLDYCNSILLSVTHHPVFGITFLTAPSILHFEYFY